MTKLVIVLAAVIVVILVIVIIAVRSMRAEDPEEFADGPGGRGPSRGSRDVRYERHPAPGGRSGRPAQRQAGGTGRPAGASAGRGFDERRDQRSRGYDQRMQDGRGSGRNGDGRRGDGRTQRRSEESQAPASVRQARSRRSGDSSEWDSSEWEKLSDVDYWAELAADKPLTTTAQPAAQARPAPDRDTQALARRGPAAGPPPRQDPATGLPVRGRPQGAEADLTVAAAARTDFTPAPVPLGGTRDQLRPVAEAPGEVGLSRQGDPASLPGLSSPAPAMPQGRPRIYPDDDPLTSPSFPRIPAADSRSYRNGRADTPPRGSSAPVPYLATTQQFASYGSPGPDYPGNGSRDTSLTNPNGYRPDPLLSRDPYPAPADPPPARPAPAAPAAAGNPYGSYVTPDSQATVSGYGEYSGAHSRPAGNGHESYLPAESRQPAGNGYWHDQPSLSGSIADPATASYLDGSRQYPDPLGAASHRADYGSGHPAHDPAGYPPSSYPAVPHDPAGYAPLDPYGPDGYGGYPGYGAAGR
ncbi:MAG TPA: hypothetical protein VH307_25775 [Streptosporangiaceae bacterium]|nr:hypothetical protein [Streptosporangiaceae bacterium]